MRVLWESGNGKREPGNGKRESGNGNREPGTSRKMRDLHNLSMAGLAARNYQIEEYLETVCPACIAAGQSSQDNAFIDGVLASHDGKLWMRRWCPTHGESESLYEEDLEIWQTRSGWATPTLTVNPDRPHKRSGLSVYADGLPASHGQHTCILLLNITENCNYACPTCYATSLPPGTAAGSPLKPSIAELLHTVDVVIEREGGKLGVVMLSGGEPTVRPDLPELIKELAARNITRVLINTNGRRIVRDDRFAALLAELPDRVEVFLQFDGLNREAVKTFRGEDVVQEKLTALDRLERAQVCTTLVATVAQGVNDDQVGEVFRLGLDREFVTGVAFQPVFGSGRGSGIDPQNRVTPTGIIRRLSNAVAEVTPGDFIPLPCSHRDCCDIGYWLRTPKDGWRSVVDLVGRDELKRWIHLVSNTISFENSKEMLAAVLKDGVLQRIFSEQNATSSAALAIDTLRMCDCVPGLHELVDAIWKRGQKQERTMARSLFRVTVKQFMDAHTFHSARLRQCCVHTGTFEEDPRRLSFCWRWLFPDATDFPGHESTLRVLP